MRKLNEFKIRRWAKICGIDDPRKMESEWGKCKKCDAPAIPLKPFKSKEYIGFQNYKHCLNCGSKLGFGTSTAVPATEEGCEEWRKLFDGAMEALK